jgi:hypothetical protein
VAKPHTKSLGKAVMVMFFVCVDFLLFVAYNTLSSHAMSCCRWVLMLQWVNVTQIIRYMAMDGWDQDKTPTDRSPVLEKKPGVQWEEDGMLRVCKREKNTTVKKIGGEGFRQQAVRTDKQDILYS